LFFDIENFIFKYLSVETAAWENSSSIWHSSYFLDNASKT